MFRLNIYFKEGVKNGKKYKVAHTADFGFDVSVSLSSTAPQIQQDPISLQYFIIYDPTKAGMKMLPSGYMQMVIG